MLRSLLSHRTTGLLAGIVVCTALALPAQAQNALGGTSATSLVLLEDWAGGIGMWTQSEVPDGAGEGWRVANEINPDDNLENVARLRNFDRNIAATDYLLTSPTFAVPQVTGLTLMFDVAYAQRDTVGGTISETLEIEVSTNAGASYSFAASLTGVDLDTVAPLATAFKPASAADWEARSIDLSAFAPMAQDGAPLRIRFSVVNQEGNNLYLDNIKVTTSPAAVFLDGVEGWRMLANPTTGTSYDEVIGSVWTQGFPGADNTNGSTNVLLYDESVIGDQSNGYTPPADQANTWSSGTGAFVYVYSDDDNDGSAEGFPKTLTASGVLPSLPFNFPVTYTETTPTALPDEDGWNLLGNPYDRTIDWDLLTAVNLDATVYVWNPNGMTAGYRTWNGTTGNLNQGLIAPFQGFWVKANATSPSLMLDANAVTTGGIFSGRQSAIPVIALRADATVAGVEMYGEAFLQIDPTAEADVDRLDAHFLTPLSSEYIAMMTQTEASATSLVIDARPIGADALSFALDAIAVEQNAPIGTAMTLTWPELRDVPETWTLSLVDHVTGTTVDLRATESYTFTTELGDETPRFAIVVNPSSVVANEPEGTPGAFALTAAFPNPFRETLTVGYTLPEAATVRVTVFDVLGREVATLVNEQVAGQQSAVLSGSELASGLYLVRVEADGAVARYETTTRVLRVE
ncbi:MAG: T9SS type A sorting domain-containing protein [Rhodothermaceae bacterium]|nr:T9SS type A sorting domain-containing protein [Rhodothermaceae bacterium]